MARGGGRGGGGRNPSNQPREVQASRALSKLLRHQAEQQGLKLGKGGYVNVQDALNTTALKSLKLTFPELRSLVATNNKQRFSLILATSLAAAPPSPTSPVDPALAASGPEASQDPADYLIRANQGHSLAVDTDGLLTAISAQAGNLPATVVHGTDDAALDLIMLGGGLRRMGRTHIHFASGLPGKSHAAGAGDAQAAAPVISGMRSSATVLVYIDLPAALAAGIPFFVSDNGVILTKGDDNEVLSYTFFKKVERRRSGEVVMRDGVLPEGVVVDVEAWRERVGDRASQAAGGRTGKGKEQK
ncbi:tRNA 2'-phosphotransferase [Coniothyrium glycines]